MSSTILLDVTDGVATLTPQPPGRAQCPLLRDDGRPGRGHLKARPSGRPAGGRHQGRRRAFHGRGDLKDFAGQLHLSPESRIASFRATIEQDINRSVEALAGLRVPVIGRVHGACAGFGLSLALGCDMVLAADTAYFTTAYGSIALSGDGGVSWFLPRIVGRHKAFELLLMAERFDAAEALRLGVANKVVPLAQLDAAVDALVGRILRGPKEAYAEMKRLLNQSPRPEPRCPAPAGGRGLCPLRRAA